MKKILALEIFSYGRDLTVAYLYLENEKIVVYAGLTDYHKIFDESFNTTNAASLIMAQLSEALQIPQDQLTFFEFGSSISAPIPTNRYDFQKVFTKSVIDKSARKEPGNGKMPRKLVVNRKGADPESVSPDILPSFKHLTGSENPLPVMPHKSWTGENGKASVKLHPKRKY